MLEAVARWHDIMYDIAADKPGCTRQPQSYEDVRMAPGDVGLSRKAPGAPWRLSRFESEDDCRLMAARAKNSWPIELGVYYNSKSLWEIVETCDKGIFQSQILY